MTDLTDSFERSDSKESFAHELTLILHLWTCQGE